MTHPDILTVEKFGNLYRERAAEKIGCCLYCDEAVYDSGEAVESKDGLFCNMDCLSEFYEIRER